MICIDHVVFGPGLENTELRLLRKAITFVVVFL